MSFDAILILYNYTHYTHITYKYPKKSRHLLRCRPEALAGVWSKGAFRCAGYGLIWDSTSAEQGTVESITHRSCGHDGHVSKVCFILQHSTVFYGLCFGAFPLPSVNGCLKSMRVIANIKTLKRLSKLYSITCKQQTVSSEADQVSFTEFVQGVWDMFWWTSKMCGTRSPCANIHDKIFGSLSTKVPCCRQLQVFLQDSHHAHDVCMRGLAAIRVAHETEVQVPEGLLFTEFHMLCCILEAEEFYPQKSPKVPCSRAGLFGARKRNTKQKPGNRLPASSRTRLKLPRTALKSQKMFVAKSDFKNTSGFSTLIAMIRNLRNLSLRGGAWEWRSARTWWSAVPQRVRIASPQKI